MIFDSHCHYNLEPFYQDGWQKHWQRAQENDVQKAIVVGTDFLTSTLATEITESDPNLFAAVGCHPNSYDNVADADRDGETDVASDRADLLLIISGKKVVAIGETGLDYFRLPNDEKMANKIMTAQKQAFRMHIQLAKEHGLPLIIHGRDKNETAYWDILELLETERFLGHFILHCVSGPMAYIQKALSMGAFLGMAGNITYKNAEHLRDLVRSASPTQLLLETDAPYLPPQEFRGQTCEPWMIVKTAEFVEQELHFDRNQLAANAQTIFGV